MEFTIARDEFLTALQRAQGIVASKGPMPILANVLIESGDTGITVFATNLNMGLRGDYRAEVAKTGKVSVHAKTLYDIVKEFPEGQMLVKTDDDGRLRITCGKSKFNLATISAEEFPAFPEYDKSGFIPLDSEMLAEMISKTSYAVSQDETRMTLNGAYLEVSRTKARMVATDGHRLALIDRDGAFGVEDTVKLIIAKRAVNELARFVGEGNDATPLEFLQQTNHVIFARDSLVLVIRLIDGAYPNYQQVIPEEFNHKAVVVADDLAHSLRRIAPLVDDKTHMIRLAFDDGKLDMASEGGEMGEARDEIDAQFEGETVTIGLNVTYLLELLGILKSEKVTFKIKDQLSPVLVEDPGDSGLLCIVMPMRL